MTEMDNELGAVCEAVVQETKRITPMNRDEVRRIRLQVEDPAFRFVEGQTIGVVVPGPHDFGNKYHMRRYSIASAREVAGGEALEFELLVRRCFYLDEVSGERYPGIASNYLCDAPPGARVAISGPYRSPFKMPQDPRANLLMIGTGTGVAPFRAFIQYIYKHHPDWQGKVRLFYGARTGMDLFYLNDQEDDLANYYDEKSFRAFKGLMEDFPGLGPLFFLDAVRRSQFWVPRSGSLLAKSPLVGIGIRRSPAAGAAHWSPPVVCASTGMSEAPLPLFPKALRVLRGQLILPDHGLDRQGTQIR